MKESRMNVERNRYADGDIADSGFLLV